MENLEDSLKFKTWKKSLEENKIQLKSYEELATVRKPNGEVLFTFLKMEAVDPEGHFLPSSVFIRGHFVSVVTCLKDKDTQERFYLLVKQRRVGTGGFFYEHPAGMCDSETDPYKVAIKEVEEETGLKIKQEDLFSLYDKILYSSPGLLDEAGYFFGCEISLSRNEIQNFQNKTTGDTSEHEHITTFLCPEKDALKYFQHTSGVMATLLFRQIKGIKE